MPSKKKSSSVEGAASESSQTNETIVSDAVVNLHAPCSKVNSDDESKDISHHLRLRDNIRLLEIKAEQLGVERKLMESRGQLRLLEVQMSETDLLAANELEIRHGRSELASSSHAVSYSDTTGLPKTELSYFNGDVANYWSFMSEFENNVVKKTNDDGIRLSYLKHYCRGPARQAIEGCSMLPPTEGYQVALRNLKELFGDEHQVSKALLNAVKTEIRNVGDTPIKWQLLAIRLRDCELAFKQMHRLEHLNAYETLESIAQCFSNELKDEWVKVNGRLKMKGRVADFNDMVTMVSCQANYRNNVYSHLASRHTKVDERPLRLTPRKVFLTTKATEPSLRFHCPKCSENHQLNVCPAYISLSASQRLDLAKEKKRCFNCLKGNHSYNECRLKQRCERPGCNKYHHELLHDALTGNSKVVATSMSNCDVQLGVIPVRVRTPYGFVTTLALLDSGSQVTLVKKSLADKLGSGGPRSRLSIRTASGTCVMDTSEVQLVVRSLEDAQDVHIPKAYVVSSLPCAEAPDISPASLRKWHHFRDVKLPAIENKEITLLIGSDVPEAHWVVDQRIGKRKEPFAIQTILGWIVRGPWYTPRHETYVNCVTKLSSDAEGMIERLYNQEFGDLSLPDLLSQDDVTARNLVSSSIRHLDGHYVVGLPWKTDSKLLPNNQAVALFRLRCLRNKLRKDPALFVRYCEVMEGHFKSGYAVKVPTEQRDPGYSPRWYLPHHPVINARKPDKLRIVFDCAAEYQGWSLNKCLFSGPNVVSDLTGVLLRFRENYIGIAADIKEMFLQVRVPTNDRGVLRFMWWTDRNLDSPPEEFQLTVHLFGATSSPFCANFALQKSADDFTDDRNAFLKGVVKDNFYVDDCLVSIDDVSEARAIVVHLRDVLRKGGFQLTKWVSNTASVLTGIPDKECSLNAFNIGPDSSTQRTLGMLWDFQSDSFFITYLDKEHPLTKRGLLSEVASIFDPLGFVSPLVLPGKLLFQDICKSGKGWDDPLTDEEIRTWSLWRRNLLELKLTPISRCLKPPYPIADVQLHAFADASEKAYGSVIYARFVTTDHQISCNLVIAKARVAPLKAVSIPRLELAAAVLAVRLVNKLKAEGRLNWNKIRFWTDSTIVLYYIRNTSSRYCTFVANRITEIRDHTSIEQWSHVSSSLNPADYLSRGSGANQLSLAQWISGPTFLRDPESEWPIQARDFQPKGSLIEFKLKEHTICNLTDSIADRMTTRFSCWFKLVKSIAWLNRFKIYIMIMFGKRNQNVELDIGLIKISERRRAERDVIRLIQANAFPQELKILLSSKEAKRSLPRSSRLYKLNPIVIDGMLCIDSRLRYSELTTKFNLPIILPNEHPAIKTLVEYQHKLEGHAGTNQTLNAIRNKYWILKGQRTVRNIISKCIRCKKLTARPCSQLMAPLPDARIDIDETPFSAVGIDYFGPLVVKRGRSLEKRYCCLFTCMKIRAVHLEVSHTLSTESFLMAFTRFCSRRGMPKIVYSDNGSNFIGAEAELRTHLKNWSVKTINDRMLEYDIEWIFNPPECSHRGGLWERMIRSTRRIFRAITNEQTLDDETLLTFMSETERIINNRPLCPLSDNHHDIDVLTPSKILMLKHNDARINTSDGDNKYLRQWRKACHLATTFRKRWIKEYISTLHCRQKWRKPSYNLRPGDIVMVTSGSHSSEWPLGLITNTVSHKDGLVREVDVKTAKGIIRRDVRKICLLEGVDELG